LSASATTVPAELAPKGLSRVRNFRLIPRVDTYPAVVAFAQTIIGKLVLLAMFGLGLAYGSKDWRILTLCLALITFLPAQRRILVTISALLFAFIVPWKFFKQPFYSVALIVLVLALGAVLFWCATLWPRSWYGRRPVFVFLCSFSLLIVIASYAPQGTRTYQLVWDFTNSLSVYIWFICYSLLDRNAAGRDPLSLQLGSYRPFWGSTNTPFAKGAAYLRRIEARNPEQLAVTQLKGIKLLAWSIMLSLFGAVFNYCAYGYLHIPQFNEALYLSANRTPLPWYHCWASILVGFIGSLISFSAFGHRIIACCRMAGFNALRNTYRPLSSRTVAEFFNRYYFYFKELLVDVFFYPFFLKYFKKNHKLRMVGAIFAAACFGNAYYHFVRDLTFVQQQGLRGALMSDRVYLFYCVLLAAAISISQLRHRRPAPSGFIRGQLWPSFLVLLFFCLLDVFGFSDRNYPLTEYFRFMGHLFNLNL
jgi:hypothetical protein